MRTPDVLWFRRDLRVHDLPLLDLAEDRPVVPLFVLDPALLTSSRVGPRRRGALADALADLDAGLRERGGRLVVRRGDPRDVVPAVAAEVGAATVHWSTDVSPFAARRDEDVANRLAADGRDIRTHEGVLVQPPGAVLTQAGEPYRVFTPFYRRWRERSLRTIVQPPDEVQVPDVASDPLPSADDLDGRTPDGAPVVGERAARILAHAFLDTLASSYHRGRDALADDGTSRLSAALHYGSVSAVELVARADPDDEGHEAFVRELAFRDFYAHVLAAFPDVLTTEFDPSWRGLAWRQDPDDLTAWAEGRTGYPIVDAGMRQLASTGWMHNRARMIVASFLCKDLRVDWRLGERHFLRHLVDADLASNNGGWQWAASTGTDAQPWFRIFNPVAQGRRHDPDGRYVRRWLPELADVPARWIHAPWEMPTDEARRCGVRVGHDYPGRVVDHDTARRATLAWFEAHRAGQL